MKIVAFRRTVVARLACPVCHEPARRCPPRQWVDTFGPHRSAWSHLDGEPLCLVVGDNGFRPARRACMLTALRPAHAHRPDHRRSRTRRATRCAPGRRTVRRPVDAPPPGDAFVYLVTTTNRIILGDDPDTATDLFHRLRDTDPHALVHRCPPAYLAQALTFLAGHQRRTRVTDTRAGRPVGAS